MINAIQKYSLLLLSIFVYSCSTSNKEAAEANKNNVIDTVFIETPPENIPANPFADSLRKWFDSSASIPFSIDAKNIEKLSFGIDLHKEQLKQLFVQINQHELFMGTDYAVGNFCFIDSMKTIGNYNAWKETVDIGQVKYAESKTLARIQLNAHSDLLFWYIDYSTYEACPYSWAKKIFVTSIFKNQIGETILFAEQSGGGDAPVSFSRNLSGSISADTTLLLSLTEELDEDEPKIELTEAFYELKPIEGRFVFTKEDKKPTRKVKKKK